MTLLEIWGSVNYAIVLIFGILLSIDISGGCEKHRKWRLCALLCPLFLLIQTGLFLRFGLDTVKKLYPFIVHLPLTLALVLALKKTPGIALVSIYTAYLCCEIPNWLRMIVSAAARSELAGEISYTILIIPLFFLLRRFFVRAAHEAMTCSKWALLLFGSLPVAFYIFDYATTIYSKALYSGIYALNESLPALLVTFYVLFLTAYHVQSERINQAELQSSMLEAKWSQTQLEMDALRSAQTQTAVYQHDMRHHLNVLDSYLAAGKPDQAAAYIQKVQSDVEAITPVRYCENELVNLLCSSFAGKSEHAGVSLRINAKLPPELAISDTELCSVLSNALENALRVAANQAPKRRYIDLYCGIRLNKLLIEVKNPYSGEIVLQDGVPVSDRDGHGYGCRSIQAVANRRGGICEFKTERGVFCLRFMVPVKTGKPA